MKKLITIIIGILIITALIGIYFYPKMPDKMASHWNSAGVADGYSSRFWGVFLMPIIFIGLAAIFIAIPLIDPLKSNIWKFRKYYDRFVIIFFIFMLAVYLQTLLWNNGIKISPNILFPFLFGILSFYIGILCEKSKRNWFIGIRTPWTLSSDRVWDKTHTLAGKLFKIAGIISVFGIFFKSYAIFFILIPVLFVAVYTVVYSYFEYKKG